MGLLLHVRLILQGTIQSQKISSDNSSVSGVTRIFYGPFIPCEKKHKMLYKNPTLLYSVRFTLNMAKPH